MSVEVGVAGAPGVVVDRSRFGRATPRREDRRLLTGRSTFVADLRLAGLLEAAFVRSPLPHARIRGVDTAPAAVMPGVRAALAGGDLEGLGELPPAVPVVRPVRQPPLCRDRARYAGAPLAVVVAESRYLAEDAAEAVTLDLEELPAVDSIEAALAPGAISIHEGWPDNRLVQVVRGDPRVDEIFAGSRVVRGSYRTQRQAPSPLETRGVVAEPQRGRLVVWTSTQVPHVHRTVLARVLGLAESDVQVKVPDVGGGFGGKLHVYPEDVLVPWLALRLGRPVRWIEDRREHFLASCHAREQRHELEAALDAGGKIAALRCRILCDVGSGEIFPPGHSPALVSAASLTGPYRIPHAACSVECVVTNKTPSGAYRGFGTPEMVFALERLIDRVAAETGQDAIELRRRTLLRPEDLPYRTATGRGIDSGTHLEAFEAAVGLGRGAVRRHRERGRRVGMGVACYLEGTAPSYYPTAGLWPAWEACTLRVEPDGTVTVSSGLCASGQGLESMIATLAAAALHVSEADVRVRLGDTDATPYGLGSFGSRSTVVAAGAILDAAGRLRGKIARVAGAMLEAAPEEVVIEEGRCHVRGSRQPSLALAEVAGVAYFHTFRLPDGELPGLEAMGTYDPPVDHVPDREGRMDVCLTYGNASHCAVVEVDVGTGRVEVLDYFVVHDAGLILNPALVDGQIVGGVAQGIGGTLLEELVHDGGQLATASFMDYLLPTAAEVPRIQVRHLESTSPLTPLGLKGVGEAGITGPAAAIAGAVDDALRTAGIEVLETPIRPGWLRERIAAREEEGGHAR
jgi:carbon-monoxide dehydrogenase large subunit